MKTVILVGLLMLSTTNSTMAANQSEETWGALPVFDGA